MKRFVLILIALLLAYNTNAQTIKYRRLLDPEGLSVMTTSLDVFPWGKKKIEYALQYEVAPVEDMHQGYYLNIYVNTDNEYLYIPQKGKVLIRTTKENIISLTDSGEKEFIEYSSDLMTKESVERSIRYYDKKKEERRYLLQGRYPISDEDLARLKEEGVIKIRIETNGDPIECSYNTDQTAEVINQLYNVLNTNIDPYYGL